MAQRRLITVRAFLLNKSTLASMSTPETNWLPPSVMHIVQIEDPYFAFYYRIIEIDNLVKVLPVVS